MLVLTHLHRFIIKNKFTIKNRYKINTVELGISSSFNDNAHYINLYTGYINYCYWWKNDPRMYRFEVYINDVNPIYIYHNNGLTVYADNSRSVSDYKYQYAFNKDVVCFNKRKNITLDKYIVYKYVNYVIDEIDIAHRGCYYTHRITTLYYKFDRIYKIKHAIRNDIHIYAI